MKVPWCFYLFFDGKICLLWCIERVQARNNSARRPAGTWESKPKSIDSDYYYELMTRPGGVFDNIKQKMPWLRNSDIFLQHDGAKPHNGGGNLDRLTLAGLLDGWHIRIVTQPAQSPDVNINDLGFFNSLKNQVGKIKNRARNIDELMANVDAAYTAYDHVTLDHIWGHLFTNYNSILQHLGNNTYNSPHGNLRTAGRNLDTVVNLNYDVNSYNTCQAHFNL